MANPRQARQLLTAVSYIGSRGKDGKRGDQTDAIDAEATVRSVLAGANRNRSPSWSGYARRRAATLVAMSKALARVSEVLAISAGAAQVQAVPVNRVAVLVRSGWAGKAPRLKGLHGQFPFSVIP